MAKSKYAFIDRDGTLIEEPANDFQVDTLEKLVFEPQVVSALLGLQELGYKLVMISNQDGLGTDSFPQESFDASHNKMLDLFTSENIVFEEVLICPHLPKDECGCRKPKLGLVKKYLEKGLVDFTSSLMIGDRPSDEVFATGMGIKFIQYERSEMGWPQILESLAGQDRVAEIVRVTNETSITAYVNLDKQAKGKIFTGIDFLDHMLDQIGTHGGFTLNLYADGDLIVDDHHTIEDIAITLGQTIKEALSDKKGIDRFGFTLPMDETQATCVIDLSGRPYFKFDATFTRERVGGLATEMVQHFFRSLAFALECNLHLSAVGENNHHMIESLFKSFGRCMRQAIKVDGSQIASSKGSL